MDRSLTEGVILPAIEQELGTLLARILSGRIGAERYDLWFQNRTRFTWGEDGLVVGVPNRICQEFLQAKYGRELAAAVEEVMGKAVPIRFIIDPELFRAARQAEAEVAENPIPQSKPAREKQAPIPSEQSEKSAQPRKKPQRKRRWRSLQDFIVGPCNRVAHASALAVVETPGLDVNPLVLHGPVGTGKTHLLEGIYVELRKAHSDWRICYVTAEDFTNRFVQAMRQGKLSSFRKYFRDCDVLLLDDLHFLASKRATQEEFLHTLDALQADGLQVVATCDCHPRLNEQFLPELTDRLLGGGIWGIMPPDFDTRLNLLRAKSVERGSEALSEEVVQFLAEQLRGNVRELEGALNSLFHFSRVTGRKIDTGMAREVLGDLLRHTIRVIKMPDIDEAICHFLHMAAGSLQGRQRSWAYSHPRMIAMYLARKHTSATYTEVGRYFGKHSHSTVVAAEKRVRQWLQDDHHLNLGSRNMRVCDLIERIERDLLQ